jgi:signal transduction histidine kinase
VRVRAALAAGLSAACAFGVGGLWLRETVESNATAAALTTATATARAIAATYEQGGEDRSYPYSLDTWVVAGLDGRVRDSNGDLARRVRPGELAMSAERVEELGWGDDRTLELRVLDGPHSPIRGRTAILVAAPVRPVAGGTPTQVVHVLVSREPVDAALAGVDRVLLPGIPAAVLLVGLIAWLVTRQALRPVEAIRRELAGITTSDLRRRVPVPAAKDEIRRLAVTTNATLNRLDAAVDAQRRFVADAAHELRSPLTVLRNRLEVALAHPDPDAWPQVAADAAAATRRLQALTDDLLLLARLDHGGERPGAGAVVDLGAVVAEQVEERLHRDRGGRGAPAYTTGIGPGTEVGGDESQLGRILRNLLDNAERHAAGAVHVTVLREGDAVVATVGDDGPGVPPGDRERVFERFTRLDDARARDAGGTGLGLSIAREIAVHHGGTLEATDGGPGALFVLRLPAATAAAASAGGRRVAGPGGGQQRRDGVAGDGPGVGVRGGDGSLGDAGDVRLGHAELAE